MQVSAVSSSTTKPSSIDGTSTSAMVTIVCCMCGLPSTTPTCASCLASTTDITRGISTEATLHQCRGCQRWHKEAGKWIACELESRELMALCLSHVSGLQKRNANQQQNKIRLVDAAWIWTEPHSMRLKVRLTIQRQVESATILQQSFTVVFIVRNQQCLECQSVFRQGSWKSLVQVRQRVRHKRTFLYLEQLILKHDAHRGCLQIQLFANGMDFYFPDKGSAARFVSFLESVCPIQTKASKKLIGTDDKSNISNFKYTHLVEICPLCKDDLLLLPTKLARQLGNIARLVLVKNISNVIHLIDPLTGQTASMTPQQYWRQAMDLRPLITAARSRLTRYMVLGKEAVFLRRNVSKRTVRKKQKSRLARITFAREDDLGVNDVQLEEQSHIGYLLKAGDICVGYDLRDTQFVDDTAEDLRAKGQLPDVVLVRKLYGVVASGNGDDSAVRQRIWRLQRLDMDTSAVLAQQKGKRNDDEEDMDEEDFLQEVESDRDMRINMNLYKSDLVKRMQDCQLDPVKEGGTDSDMVEGDPRAQCQDNDDQEDEDDEDDDQKVNLDELLDGLALDQGPDAEDDKQGKDDDSLLGIMGGVLAEGEKAQQDGITYVSREEARRVRDKDSAVPVTGGVMGKDFLAPK